MIFHVVVGRALNLSRRAPAARGDLPSDNGRLGLIRALLPGALGRTFQEASGFLGFEIWAEAVAGQVGAYYLDGVASIVDVAEGVCA